MYGHSPKPSFEQPVSSAAGICSKK